ncbi:MAG: tRNA (N(6)-L-threonylcarbamoyladenosine(37)-C(2))-methylthiotransferase MtaB [Chloroflexi bacterium]|nr:tRNA (N(6)-L-threonylcarbamoyladenosine(37)-C(2))-methylthiotransferase MtaB [Chloroflexota bacterium]
MVTKVRIETHGCKLNMADSQRLAREFIAAGFRVTEDDAPDVYVLNSCTVTHVADRKARHALAAARRANPSALIVASGCYAERAPVTVEALMSVDLVVTNREKAGLVERVVRRLGLDATPCSDGAARNGSSLLGRTRAFIKIQEGCNQVCAYCIVPRVRGRERSISPVELVRQVKRASDEGLQEVVLTGTQLGSYGFDLEGVDLAGMIRQILAETEIPRIRVSSLQPLEMTDQLVRLWSAEGEGRLCPHFHMPLQSGSDAVLSRMRRRYTSRQYLDAVDRARQAAPEASITSDVIAGFPGETAEDFEATADVMRVAAFAGAHVFPYSARPGTSAAHFEGQLAPEVKAERASRLRELAETSAAAFRRSQLGATRQVLWETDVPEPSGLTDNYLRVVLARPSLLEDRRVMARNTHGRALPAAAAVGSSTTVTPSKEAAATRANTIEAVRLVALDGERVLVHPA